MDGLRLSGTAVSRGYYMPAEWHPHAATWLTWPKNAETWPGRLGQVEEVYLEWIELLAARELVKLLVDDESTAESVAGRLLERGVTRGRACLEVLPTVDSWIRDYGPNFLISRSGSAVAFNNWRFDAWGGKYQDLAGDDRVPEEISRREEIPYFTPGITLEGGAIDVNGAGLCLTTRQCLLNPNRNPGLSQQAIEGYLHDFLGVQRVIWLNQGIAGDDTDGHIDDIARFVDPTTVVCVLTEDSDHPDHAVLKENLAFLREFEEEGLFRVRTLNVPDPVTNGDEPLPASYANFYIANGQVLVPTFDQPENDRRALETLTALFPKREVIGLRATDLVLGLGSLHCLSQQQPLTRP